MREYVEAWGSPRLGHGLSPEMFTVGLHVSTIGPEGCYGGLLVIEKDGLLPALEAAEIDRRFDLMIASAQARARRRYAS